MKRRLFVGTYTGGASKGLYTCDWDDEGPELAVRSAAACRNPSYMAVSRRTNTLYSVLETREYQGAPGGAVAAFRIGESGELAQMGERASGGVFPCHLSISSDGGHLFVANYGSGTLGVFPLGEEGALLDQSLLVRHQGGGPNPSRQEGPHCHFAKPTPDSKYLLVNDLGLDTLFMYPLDAKEGIVQKPVLSKAAPGGGPRHCAISGDGRFIYALMEMGNCVEVYAYTAGEALRRMQSIATLPENFNGESTTAAIRLSADGRHLYASNRGHDSVAAYSVGEDGLLHPLGVTKTGGKTPRDIALSPDGKWLLCANQDSGCITALAIGEDGALKDAGHTFALPSPVCLVFDEME